MSASNDIKFDFPELISFFKSRFGDLIVPDYQRMSLNHLKLLDLKN